MTKVLSAITIYTAMCSGLANPDCIVVCSDSVTYQWWCQNDIVTSECMLGPVLKKQPCSTLLLWLLCTEVDWLCRWCEGRIWCPLCWDIWRCLQDSTWLWCSELTEEHWQQKFVSHSSSSTQCNQVDMSTRPTFCLPSPYLDAQSYSWPCLNIFSASPKDSADTHQLLQTCTLTVCKSNVMWLRKNECSVAGVMSMYWVQQLFVSCSQVLEFMQ